MSADARYFLDQVRVYEAKKQKDREEVMRAKVLGEAAPTGSQGGAKHL